MTGNPLLDYKSEQRERRVELLGGFELHLVGIKSGTLLVHIQKVIDGRKKGRVLLQQEFGVPVQDSEIENYTWLEFCCKGIYKDGEKVGDGVTWKEAIKAAQEFGETLIKAGMIAQCLSYRVDVDELEKKILTLSSEETSRENLSSPAESGWDAPPQNLTEEELTETNLST